MKQSHPSTLEWMYLKTGQLLLNAKFLRVSKFLKYLGNDKKMCFISIIGNISYVLIAPPNSNRIFNEMLIYKIPHQFL